MSRPETTRINPLGSRQVRPSRTSPAVDRLRKDRRLARSLGEDYRAYQARVPGYPGIPFGPLARLP